MNKHNKNYHVKKAKAIINVVRKYFNKRFINFFREHLNVKAPINVLGEERTAAEIVVTVGSRFIQVGRSLPSSQKMLLAYDLEKVLHRLNEIVIRQDVVGKLTNDEILVFMEQATGFAFTCGASRHHGAELAISTGLLEDITQRQFLEEKIQEIAKLPITSFEGVFEEIGKRYKLMDVDKESSLVGALKPLADYDMYLGEDYRIYQVLISDDNGVLPFEPNYNEQYPQFVFVSKDKMELFRKEQQLCEQAFVSGKLTNITYISHDYEMKLPPVVTANAISFEEMIAFLERDGSFDGAKKLVYVEEQYKGVQIVQNGLFDRYFFLMKVDETDFSYDNPWQAIDNANSTEENKASPLNRWNTEHVMSFVQDAVLPPVIH